MKKRNQMFCAVACVALGIASFVGQTHDIRADESVSADQIAELKKRVEQLEGELKSRDEKIGALQELLKSLHQETRPVAPRFVDPQAVVPQSMTPQLAPDNRFRLIPEKPWQAVPEGTLRFTPVVPAWPNDSNEIPGQPVPNSWIPSQINGLTFYFVPCDRGLQFGSSGSAPQLIPQNVPMTGATITTVSPPIRYHATPPLPLPKSATDIDSRKDTADGIQVEEVQEPGRHPAR